MDLKLKYVVIGEKFFCLGFVVVFFGFIEFFNVFYFFFECIRWVVYNFFYDFCIDSLKCVKMNNVFLFIG